MAIHTPEMTVTENTAVNDADTVNDMPDAAPVNTADGPDTPAPDTDTTDGTNARVEAVLAVLESLPGGSATGIGAAAGLSRVAAGKLLNQMEADGLVRREAGGHDGQSRGRTPDRWFPVTDDTPTTDAPPTDENTTPETAMPDVPEAPPMGEQADHNDPIEETDDQPDAEPPPPAPDPAGVPEEAEVELAPAAVNPNDANEEPDDDAADGSGADLDEAADEAHSHPVADPAWDRARAELMELADLLGGVVAARDANSDDVMALGRLEMAMAKAAAVHRNARAVLTGTANAPARAASPRSGNGGGAGTGGAGGMGVRPSALRDRVHAHLVEHPGKDFTPYEIGRVLDASSGAVANALDRLVSLGQAELTCERPRRFSLTPTATAPTATTPGTDSAPHTPRD